MSAAIEAEHQKLLKEQNWLNLNIAQSPLLAAQLTMHSNSAKLWVVWDPTNASCNMLHSVWCCGWLRGTTNSYTQHCVGCSVYPVWCNTLSMLGHRFYASCSSCWAATWVQLNCWLDKCRANVLIGVSCPSRVRKKVIPLRTVECRTLSALKH